MAKVFRVSDTFRDDAMDAGVANYTSGAIKIYSGSLPGTVCGTPSGSLLATLALDSTPVAASSAGVASFNDLPLNVTASATGTAGIFQIENSSGNVISEGNVGTSDTTLILSTTSLVAGVAVTITAASHTLPNGS